MNMPLVLLNRRRRGGSFSPYSLFSGTAIGTWFDPSDLATMYQDAAGTTAVTTPGQPVGLRLDKSKGLALGAELVGGVWSGTGNAQDGTVFSGDDLEYWATEFATVIGRSYRFTATLSGKVNNSQIRFRAGISGTGTALYSSNNDALPLTVNILVVATSTTSNIEILFRSASASVTLSNISVRELAGNHATQSVLASRPVYGIEPAGGRRNLLTYSEQFGTSPWANIIAGTGIAPTVTADAGNDPTGAATADRVQLSLNGGTASGDISRRVQPFITPTTAHVFSVYLKSTDGTSSYNMHLVGPDGTTNNITVTGSWQRFSVSAIGSGGSVNYAIGLRGAQTPANANTADVLAWGAQLELGSTATPYQRVTTAFDVTEAGVQTCHYVQYDGSDDGMITNSIDFTATDKMSVFAGVRKNSDALESTILELSANSLTNNGSFQILGPDSAATSTYRFYARGDTASTGYVPTGYAAPLTNVITSLLNFAGADRSTEVIPRINGVLAQVGAAGSGSAGGGNFGNYPLYIGRRGGASLPFNGRDYGILVVGKATTAEEIASTEKWLANKTGVTI